MIAKPHLVLIMVLVSIKSTVLFVYAHPVTLVYAVNRDSANVIMPPASMVVHAEMPLVQ